MSIASFFEKVLIGDKKIKPDALRLMNSGYDSWAAGNNVGEEGLNGLRSSVSDYDARLKSGRALPDSVYKSYDRLQGGLRDTSARDVGALNARLAQARLSSGGMLSPEAAQEMAGIGEAGIHDQEFGAQTQLGVARSRDELSATQDLMSRLDTARNNILNYGQFKQQLGYSAAAQGLMARIQRATAIGNNAVMVGNTASGLGK